MKNLATALVEAQKEMRSVPKDAENKGFKRDGKVAKYVSLDRLIEETKPRLAEHGLVVLQPPTTTAEGHPALRTILLHESGEFIEDTVPLPIAAAGAHGFGAALTYARRYAWASILGIANDEDDDGNTAVGGEPRADKATGSGNAGNAASGSGPVPAAGRQPEPPSPSKTDAQVKAECETLTRTLIELSGKLGHKDFHATIADHQRDNDLVEHKAWLEAAVTRATTALQREAA